MQPIGVAFCVNLMKRRERQHSHSLLSTWKDTTSLYALLYTFIQRVVTSNLVRLVMSVFLIGCEPGQSSIAFFAGKINLVLLFQTAYDIQVSHVSSYSSYRLLRRDPMGALGYAAMKPSLTKIAESTDGRPHEMSVVAALRSGEVLGSQTVLKSDHSPGCQILSLPERVEGAPNFREVPGFPVYGVANPTIDGIRSVIERVGSSRGGRPVFWHNMREEPVIYINGKPFVLREVERPYKNMLEYTVNNLCVFSLLADTIYLQYLWWLSLISLRLF